MVWEHESTGRCKGARGKAGKETKQERRLVL